MMKRKKPFGKMGRISTITNIITQHNGQVSEMVGWNDQMITQRNGQVSKVVGWQECSKMRTELSFGHSTANAPAMHRHCPLHSPTHCPSPLHYHRHRHCTTIAIALPTAESSPLMGTTISS
jgi:hypothetical protein